MAAACVQRAALALPPQEETPARQQSLLPLQPLFARVGQDARQSAAQVENPPKIRVVKTKVFSMSKLIKN